MSDLTLSLPEPLGRFVEEQVQSGAYPDVASVIRAGVERLREDAGDEAAKLARLNAMLQAGLDDFEAGRFEVVDDVTGWLDSLGRGQRSAATA